jgi:hypothetical protein
MAEPSLIVVPSGTKLDLGSGPRPAAGFRGVDCEPITDYQLSFDTGLPWPFEDDSVEELRACHVIEHIDAAYAPEWVKAFESRDSSSSLPLGWITRGGYRWQRTDRRKDLLLHFFDEAFRVIKPGGKFEVRWPNVQHVNASGDPTHRRFISPRLIVYLGREGRETAGVSQYVVNCNWKGISFHQTQQKEIIDLGVETLGARNVHEWNLCEESVMLLEAVK